MTKRASPLGMIVGTKAIIPYLRSFMSLNDDPDKAWRTIKRWQKFYHLPIHQGLNNQPSIIPEEIALFFSLAREGLKQGVQGDNISIAGNKQ